MIFVIIKHVVSHFIAFSGSELSPALVLCNLVVNLARHLAA